MERARAVRRIRTMEPATSPVFVLRANTFVGFAGCGGGERIRPDPLGRYRRIVDKTQDAMSRREVLA